MEIEIAVQEKVAELESRIAKLEVAMSRVSISAPRSISQQQMDPVDSMWRHFYAMFESMGKIFT